MLVALVKVTVNSAAMPSVTVPASAATLASIGSSSAMVPVAVAVPRLTPAGSTPDATRVTVNTSFPSARRSAKVVTAKVALVVPAVTVTVPEATAV